MDKKTYDRIANAGILALILTAYSIDRFPDYHYEIIGMCSLAVLSGVFAYFKRMNEIAAPEAPTAEQSLVTPTEVVTSAELEVVLHDVEISENAFMQVLLVPERRDSDDRDLRELDEYVKSLMFADDDSEQDIDCDSLDQLLGLGVKTSKHRRRRAFDNSYALAA